MTPGELTLAGSCLCGSVNYEITGHASRFYHCHCERCRKATGTGHASNIILQEPATLRWISGEDLLTRYKVPEAKRFAVVFCRICGSLMPRSSPEAGIVVVPAGTLDTEPGIRPEARIFDGSRALWSCTAAELPCFDTYPE